jgi:hypothetical protein
MKREKKQGTVLVSYSIFPDHDISSFIFFPLPSTEDIHSPDNEIELFFISWLSFLTISAECFRSVVFFSFLFDYK